MALQANMMLCREGANEEVVSIPWDSGAVLRYKMDASDISELESGKVLWRGSTAFSLEEKEEE